MDDDDVPILARCLRCTNMTANLGGVCVGCLGRLPQSGHVRVYKHKRTAMPSRYEGNPHVCGESCGRRVIRKSIGGGGAT